MSAVSGGNYMSDGAIMAWVSAQQDRLYGDLKATMGEQEQQAQMQSDFADLKKNLEVATRYTEKYPDISAEMQEFLDKYGDMPQFDELTSTVREIKLCIDTKMGEREVSPAGTNHHGNAAGTTESSQPAADTAAESAYGKFTKESITGWMDILDKKLDDAGTNQQLGMIHLNEIRATIDQSTQMASQMVKSGNDALNTVLNNFV